MPTNKLCLSITNIQQNKKTGTEPLKYTEKRILNGSMYNIFSSINTK